ncbi:DNA-binding NarL/FixJ family response regulator [Erwinia toletana]|uniref:DNA-binding NarL/FixJ family response regulator n=1 Tax=Winslowiella toletana TaxID=92490 RepID=A0ABS4P9W6_9GAMM|nr:response regulator transcription factor [Winslowiella toletana]MBP2169426.1 DNA-binding NarL/FixJ family response regulator [Winslowiella toletana]
MECDYTILLVDKCFLSRLGISGLLEEMSYHHCRFTYAASLHQARVFINQQKFSAVILDSENNITLASTKSFLREARLKSPETRLIVLTSNFSLSLLRMSQTLIINGFLYRRESLLCLAENLQLILFANENRVSPWFIQQAEHAVPVAAGLTPAESRTLRLLLEGKTLSQIGRLTQRSVKTISSQKRSMMRKLGITRNSQLILLSKNLYQSFY